ncbi:MAG TPA: hypothetical protein VGC56_11360 [Allosphingosinicella sp.]
MRRAVILAAVMALSLGTGWPGAARVFRDSSVRNLALPAPARLIPIAVDGPQPRAFSKNDVLLRYRVDRPPVARITKAVSIEAAGKSFAFPAGEEFALSIAEHRMQGRLPERSLIFCGEAKVNATAVWLMPIASKFGAETRPCFVDSDGDMAFDKFFLSGTKREEDSAFLPLQPLPFTVRERTGGAGDHADFVFRGFKGPGFIPKVAVKRYVDGKETPFNWLMLGATISLMSDYYEDFPLFANAGTTSSFPVTAHFFGAQVEVASLDAATKGFSGAVRRGQEPIWVYFGSGREKYVPIGH